MIPFVVVVEVDAGAGVVVDCALAPKENPAKARIKAEILIVLFMILFV
jgi:hypothetical protein